MGELKGKRIIDQRLSHLSEKEIDSVIWMYLGNKVNVRDIVKKFDIDIDPGSLHKILPPFKTNRICEHCGEPLYRRIEARNQFKGKYQKHDYFCLFCGHQVFESSYYKSCKCNKCQGNPGSVEIEKRKKIIEFYTKEHKKFDFEKIKFEDQIPLLYLLKLNMGEDKGIVIPFVGNQKWSDRINRFIDKGYLTVSPNSDLVAFEDNEDFPEVYFIYKVKYDVNVFISEKERLLIDNHQYFKNFPAPADKIAVFKEYIYDDLLQKFNSMMQKQCVNIEMPDYAKRTFRELIDKISYGEILYFLDKVSKHFGEKISNGTMNEKEVSALALANVSKFYNRNIKNKWAIHKYKIEQIGEELLFFIQFVLDSDLSVLEEVPTLDYFLSFSKKVKIKNKEEMLLSKDCEPDLKDVQLNITRNGETAEAFAKKLCQFWILCFPEMPFGELMANFLESLEEPAILDDEEFLESFRMYCRNKTVNKELS